MRRSSNPKAGPGAAALCLLLLGLLGAARAWAHGADELLLFAYLAEEPNLLRLSAGFMGGALLLLGSYIALAGMREGRKSGKAEPGSALQMMGPGAFIAAVGAAVLLSAAFILPERLRPPHAHPAAGPAPERALPRRPGGAY